MDQSSLERVADASEHLKPGSAVFFADGYKLAKQAYAHGVPHLHQVAHQLGALVRRIVLKKDLEPSKRTSI